MREGHTLSFLEIGMVYGGAWMVCLQRSIVLRM